MAVLEHIEIDLSRPGRRGTGLERHVGGVWEQIAGRGGFQQLVADLTLDKHILQDVLSKKF